MEKQINKSLLELEESLSGIKNWVDLMRKSEQNTLHFLEEGERLFETAAKSLQIASSNQKQSAETFEKNIDQVSEDTREMLTYYQHLAEATAKLVEYLRSVNFPARLDRMDQTIASIQGSVQSLSEKLDRQFDRMVQKQEEQEKRLSKLGNQSIAILILMMVTILMIAIGGYITFF